MNTKLLIQRIYGIGTFFLCLFVLFRMKDLTIALIFMSVSFVLLFSDTVFLNVDKESEIINYISLKLCSKSKVKAEI